MPKKNTRKLLTSFDFQDTRFLVEFDTTTNVTPGVTCDVYRFTNDTGKDLGIIHIEGGHKTPLQRVLKGDKTIEGYISGKGKLTITKTTGQKEIFEFNNKSVEPFAKTVAIGELMQWEANKDSTLVAYEVCVPPYKDGRYENVEE